MGLKLCGGIFFSLFLEAKKENLSANEHFIGKCSDLNEKEAYKALALCVQPDLGKSYGDLKDAVSSFKKCTGLGGDFFPFADKSGQISIFDERVKSDYQSALRQMCIFVHDFMKCGMTTKDEYKFVARMLDLIDKDDSIKDETLFYINRNGQPVSKTKLLELKEICLQPFMLGVLHVALTNSESNRDGKDTFNLLFPSKNNSHRRYVSGLDESKFMPDLVYLCDIPDEVEEIVEDVIDDDKTVFVEDSAGDAPEPQLSQQIINNNPMFLNIAGNVGTINYGVQNVNNYYGEKADGKE